LKLELRVSQLLSEPVCATSGLKAARLTRWR
jgi:hypothetical protein